MADAEPVPGTASPEQTLGVSKPIDIRSFALTGLLLLACFYTLSFAVSLVFPVYVGILASFVLTPPVRGLKRLGVPDSLGAAIVLLAVVGLFAYGLFQLQEPAARWLQQAPESLARIEQRLRSLKGPLEQMREASEQVSKITDLGGDKAAAVEVKATGVADLALSSTGSFVLTAVSTFTLVYFLLASGDLFLRKLVTVLPKLADKKRAVEIARRTQTDVSRYLLTICLINLGLGIAVTIAMHLLGMPTPLLWGAMATVLNFVPYLGALTTCITIAGVALLTFPDLGTALLPPVVFTLIAGYEGMFVTPWLLGRRFVLNPVMVFLAVVFWAWLWGIPGALIAVPTLVIVKIVCDEIEFLDPLATLLGR